MENYFCLDTKDLIELYFDMQELKHVFQNNVHNYKSDLKVNRSRFADYSIETENKGNVYLTQHKCTFNRNVITRNNGAFQSIGLYFVRKGVSYDIDNNMKVLQKFSANSSGVFFMQEDYKNRGFYKANTQQEATSLNLSFDYFKQLTNLYPDLFSDSFLRYEKGDSFYLKKQFEPTTSEMYHILYQIENSQLIGCGEKAYVDAKILELLCLQFQKPKINIKESTNSVRDYDKIREAAFIILSDIHNPPSLKELALQVGINEKKLKYGFKEVFNNTVYGYLFDYKMQLAEQLLLDSNKTIAEIAQHCGYNYPSHFCTAFKRKFGISPLQKRC